MKKSITVMIATIAILSLVLTACGSDTSTPVPPAATTAAAATTSAAAATTAAATTAASATATTAAAASTTTGAATTSATATTAAAATPNTALSGKLSFLSWYTQEQYQPLLDAFKARYPNISIDFQNVTPANNAYTQRLQLLASSGELPDIFYVQPPTTLMAKNGYLADISGLDVVKALPQAYTSAYTYNNGVYAYAPDGWVGGVFYNKALFKENNLAVPQTWADFVAAAKVFHAKGIVPISMAGDGLPDLLYWIHNTEVVTADPTFDSKIDSGQTNFTKGYLDALNTWKKDLLDPGYITQDMVGLTDDQRMTQFATGQAAMTISGPWAVAGFKQKNPNIDLGIFPFVGSTASKIETVGAVNVGLAISAKTQNKPAAQAFLSFLGSPDGLVLYQKMTGNFLGVKGVNYTVDPVMQPMQQYAQSGQFYFPPIYWTYTGTLAQMFTKGLQQVVLGVQTPDQFVKDLDAKQADLAGAQK